MSRPKATCLFYKREGYCANGDHCQFSHSVPTIPCKSFFDNKGYCRFGDACSFSHRSKQPTPTHPPPASAVQAPAPLLPLPLSAILGESRSNTSALEEEGPSIDTSSNAEFEDAAHLLQSLWDFDDDAGQADAPPGTYFYGAAGAVTSDKPSSGSGSGAASYAAIARRHAAEETASRQIVNAATRPSRTATICAFFLTGNCRYGARCLNIHDETGDGSIQINLDIHARDIPIDNIDADNLHSSSLSSSSCTPECGICMSKRPEPDGVYGVLSNCDCVFCLQCIRSWRLNGREIATSSQVRLCPLCRTESFFTIPSLVHIKRGARKDLLVQSYKESLKRVVCKFVSSNEECPFGSSCFYQHPDTGRPVHHVVNSSGNVEVKAEGVNLLEFVKIKVKPHRDR